MFPFSVPVVESNSAGVIFQEKDKIFQNLRKNIQNLKIFCKMAGDIMR